MAFLPDEAARSGREVSPPARTLYEVFCSHRNWGTGLSTCGNSTAIRESGLSRSKFFEAKRELVERGWIEETDAGVRCTKGEFKRQSRSWTGSPDPGLEESRLRTDEVQILDLLNKNNQPHVNQPHEPVHGAVWLFIQILGAAPAPKDAELIAEQVTDFNQWIETLGYWREKGHRRSNVAGMLDNYRRHAQAKQRAYVGQSQPADKAAPADLLGEIEREERENQELEGLLRSLPSEEYEQLYEQGRRETIKKCPTAWEWTKEQLRAPIEAWIKQQLKRA
jgi:hypothetical protein